MSEKLQKPYEISIWEDMLVEEEDKSYYKEMKIATIGSDVMTAPNRVSNPVFTQNVNGEITLTFDMVHKYYDDLSNDYVVNPLEKYLVNERKVKLFYDNEWYDLIIKTCEETSDSNVFTYTAKGLFVNELGKVGYNIVLSNDLRNNQGTIFELGEKAIKGTDWVIDRDNSDIIQQFVAEPLYKYIINSDLVVKDLQTNEEVTVSANEKLFLFYSTIANKQTENVFFLRYVDYNSETTTVDDNNVAQLPNYRFLETDTITYSDENPMIVNVGGAQLTREVTETNPTGINYDFQGYRLAYNQRVAYDTVKDRPVTLYEANYDNGSKKTIYKYTDYEYVTSNVVTNFITNDSNFNVYQTGSIEGWSAATRNDKVPFSRPISDLIVGDYLGETLSITNFEQIFSSLHIAIATLLATEEETDDGETVILPYKGEEGNGDQEFIYRIITGGNSAGVTIHYKWNTRKALEQDYYDETIYLKVNNGNTIVRYPANSDQYYNPTTTGAIEISISGTGKIDDIVIEPRSEVKSAMTAAMGENVIFTTTADNGKFILQPLELVTYPQITTSSLLDLANLSGATGYLRTQFKGTSGRVTEYNNSIFNDGISDHREQIESFSKGEEYVFRIAYGVTDVDGGRPQLSSEQAGKIKAVVAKYTTVPETIYNEEDKQNEQIYLYKPDVNNILFEFNGPFTLKNNIITGGYFGTNDAGEYTTYYKDGVSIAPSINNCYEEVVEGGSSITKVWDATNHVFVDQNADFLDYYYTTATCQQAISNTTLSDTANEYGIFLYIDDPNFVSTTEHPNYFCIKDVQLFKKKVDGDENIVLIGNIPKGTSISSDFFYLQPEEDMEEADIEVFSTVEAIAESLGLTKDDIKPLYNEDYEKISSIEASQSNCFNIIQDLCEAFECWARFDIKHKENGAIWLDSEGAPSKKISFHKYSGKDNFAGFKYGINLESIQRTTESDEFVSKLIVEQVPNDAVEGGTVSIAGAPSNPSGESYIINMSYYLNQGLIENPQQYYIDYNNFTEQLKSINAQYTYNKTQWQLAALARTQANANVNVYHELVEEAEKAYTESFFDFKELTGISYEDYINNRGYYINFYLTSNSEFYGIFSKFVEIIEPRFFDRDGNEILLDEDSRTESIDVVTIKYKISTGNATNYTLNDIKYIGIVDSVEGFEITNSDGDYSAYLKHIDANPPTALFSNFTKYIWEFNHSTDTDYYYFPQTSEDRKKREVRIIPSSDHEDLTELVGRIYTNQQVINDYKPLLEMSQTEKADLDLLIDGTKDYILTISTTHTTVPEGGGEVEYNTTKEFLDDYISGLSFTLSNSNGSFDVQTTITEKAFSQDALYTSITFKQYPKNYQLRYKLNDSIITTTDLVTLKIPTNGTKSFTLVPINEQKGIKDIMEDLLDQKDEVEANFYKKYSRYIQEGSWTSSDYIDNELYYLDALNVSNVNAQPKVSYNLSVNEISEQPGFENYYFKAGDKTYIEDTQFFGYRQTVAISSQSLPVVNEVIALPAEAFEVYDVKVDNDHHKHFIYDRFENTVTRDKTSADAPWEEETLIVNFAYKILTPIREEVVVSEVEWHLDDTSENTITIQNYKTQFDDLFQRMAAAVQSVEYNSASYSRAASVLDEGGFINAGLLLRSLNELGGGYSLSENGTVIASEDGIIVKDLLDPMRQMKLAGGGLKTSLDGGYNWDTVITAEGLKIDTIDTQNVLIKDGDNPSFRWDKYGLNAYGFNSSQTDLKTYVRYDKYGLYGIKDGENFQAQSLKDIKEAAQFGLLWDGFFIKNSYTDGYVSISSDEDFQIVANDRERIKIGALKETPNGYEYGIRIRNKNGETVFVTDDSGDIEMTGFINAKGGTFTDSISVGSSENSIILQGDEDEATIGSSAYFNDTSQGWAIKSDGDAIFNNITARGAIKTAVFEYSEIEAVGGIFLFRPSSTIKSAEIPIVGSEPYYEKASDNYSYDETETYYTYDEQTDTYDEVDHSYEADFDEYYIIVSENEQPVYSDDLLVEVENALLFKVGDWCKVSNCTPEDPTSTLANNGLVNVYEVTSINNGKITLHNGAQMFVNMLEPPTIIDNDNIQGIGSNNIYDLKDITDPLDPQPIENLTDKYFYDIIIVDEEEYVFCSGIPETTISTKNNAVYEKTTDTQVNPNAIYYIYDDQNDKYVEVIDPEEEDLQDYYICISNPVTYSIVFLGNLSLWSENEDDDTGETYLFITVNDIDSGLVTKLYVGEGNEYYVEQGQNQTLNLKIQKSFKSSYDIDSLTGGALVSFGNRSIVYAKEEKDWGKAYSHQYRVNTMYYSEFTHEPDFTRPISWRFYDPRGDYDVICSHIPSSGGARYYFFCNGVVTSDTTMIREWYYEKKESEYGDVYVVTNKTFRDSNPDANPHEEGWYEITTTEETTSFTFSPIENYDFDLIVDFYFDLPVYGLNVSESIEYATYNQIKNNYGIGINSSDSAVSLPARAISLFESEIYPNRDIKIGYNYRGILGTLPTLGSSKVSSLYDDNMSGTQGIFTDNMYIGDNTHYIAFYTDKGDNNKKKLRINGADIWFTYDDGRPPESIDQRFDEVGVLLTIESSRGTTFESSNIVTILTAHIYKEGTELLLEDIHELGYQVNWYAYNYTYAGQARVGASTSYAGVVEVPLLEDSMTYNVDATDEIEIIAKLEEISESDSEGN